ncbi:MAG: MFS transporter [Symbiopectobacterium sp.]
MPFSLLYTLLIASRLSDHVERRPMIAAALLLNIAAIFCFLFTSNPYELVIARIVQGFASGLVTATVGAALLDVHPKRRSLVNSIVPLRYGRRCDVELCPAGVFAGTTSQRLFATRRICAAVNRSGMYIGNQTVPHSNPGGPSLRHSVTVSQQARTAFWHMLPGNIAV